MSGQHAPSVTEFLIQRGDPGRLRDERPDSEHGGVLHTGPGQGEVAVDCNAAKQLSSAASCPRMEFTIRLTLPFIIETML